ncbi:MAG: 3-phosphoserine/phosphohydroxythreonine transaminase [Wenzhouxiangella sp.]|nr:3-phosphoserine/phosphohydroxythreonine transaminase [Wenzhouxiangella sp.]
MAEVIANFSAGPSALPRSVRQDIADELSPRSDATPSIIEVSHRGPAFGQLAEELSQRLAALTGVGDSHHLMLLQGGANLQFAQLPLNLAQHAPAGFIVTGHWGEKAMAEAKRVGQTRLIATTQDSGYTELPEAFVCDHPVAYAHITGNETVHGVQFDRPPELNDATGQAVPMVADLSSEFLSRVYPYASLAGFYAGTQKNLGVPGLTIVGLAKDWWAQAPAQRDQPLAKYLDYQAWIDAQSMLNTPSTFAWYVALKMLRWIEDQGGLEVIEQRNRAKAERLYACIDGSGLYTNPVDPAARSMMNVVFRLVDARLHDAFLAGAEQAGLLGLKGHRAVGGLRASLYNAIEADAVGALVEYMQQFERSHG